ncbi:MAG: hypothetical protein WCF08_05205 [Anaerolineaceae bacterium]
MQIDSAINVSLIDTFSDFLKFWEKVTHLDLDQQIEAWEMDCMGNRSELLQLQIADYASQGEDWRQVGAKKIFPFVESRLVEMQAAHDILLAEFEPICRKAQAKLGFNQNLAGLIHVGIGCGAGWVTLYAGKQTILFGLENIAECHWSNGPSLKGLIAHEIGHVVQAAWRSEAGLKDYEESWWQLFIEGFAQQCEHLILGLESWHMASSSDGDWLAWCQQNRGYLANRFLEDTSQGNDISPFFGSWHTIRGHSQCGYFLGHEAIQDILTSGMTFREILLLENPEHHIVEAVKHLALVG